VFGNDAQDTGIEADVWRFYLAANRPEGQDSNFSWSDLALRNNSELLNNLGNFINRALVFCEKNFSSTINEIKLNDDDLILLALINREIKEYVSSMEKTRYRDAIRHTLSVSRHGNQYMQTEQPWVLIKGTNEQKARAGSVISMCCNITYCLANLIFPFMPATARKIYSQLGVSGGHIKPL
jgi:methionyl-tRNA synthetase